MRSEHYTPLPHRMEAPTPTCARRSSRLSLSGVGPLRTEARGRTVDEWKLKASAVDNHWLDALVGYAVAASISGIAPFRGAGPKKVKRKRKRVSYIS